MQRDGGARGREFIRIAGTLLDTLAYMHPDVKAAAKIRGKDELTADEFRALSRAQQGTIHRDIKPENILLTERGPVLIDFNISVRAAAPVTTMSLTPGYLPKDFNGVSWTPEIDIYALGVTLAQTAAGARLDGENLQDLLLMARARHGADLANWLESLLSDGRSADAREYLRTLRSVEQRVRRLGPAPADTEPIWHIPWKQDRHRPAELRPDTIAPTVDRR